MTMLNDKEVFYVRRDIDGSLIGVEKNYKRAIALKNTYEELYDEYCVVTNVTVAGSQTDDERNLNRQAH